MGHQISLSKTPKREAQLLHRDGLLASGSWPLGHWLLARPALPSLPTFPNGQRTENLASDDKTMTYVNGSAEFSVPKNSKTEARAAMIAAHQAISDGIIAPMQRTLFSISLGMAGGLILCSAAAAQITAPPDLFLFLVRHRDP